jgi:hypothetical protein
MVTEYQRLFPIDPQRNFFRISLLPSPPDSLWPAVTCENDFIDFDVIALLGRADFERARKTIGDLLRWRDYEDFLCERDGEFLALSSAGAAVSQQRIPLAAFNRWARLTGCKRTLAALDDFAAYWRVRRTHLDWPVRGALVTGDVVETGDTVGASEGHSQRGALLIPIAQDVFAKWDHSVAILKLFRNPNSIDQYAALIAETCLVHRSCHRRK